MKRYYAKRVGLICPGDDCTYEMKVSIGWRVGLLRRFFLRPHGAPSLLSIDEPCPVHGGAEHRTRVWATAISRYWYRAS